MNDPHHTDAEGPPSAADALAIIEREQARTSSKVMPNIALFYALWGAIWLATGVLFFLLDPATASWATAAVVAVGVVTSAVLGARPGRGVTGASTRQGLFYGLGWAISLSAVGVFVAGMAALGVPGTAMAVLSPALLALVVGALYLLTGATWSSIPDFALGAWVMVVAVASVFAGLPGNSLVLGLGVGGGLLVVAGLRLTRGRRA
ncbi:hypothetical protein [Pseudonocardia asaccharolytica]|uniref:Uncharacterized protein n=1 Tax=Pseudonocardia asaccharolytica DSM 44247 = NBRC 16224 TaxID=1123024 RepID=A0A511CVA3_9PSEU|nr:hypothetical protein [Pseudonocardia asaccharolytica]GEL16502.1 hypothetical protein PA7_03390 [Pseudonocardia asaccharolytica DSM 44247 = NBRC 16224]